MRTALIRPILGVLVAIAITTTMDATGLTALSAPFVMSGASIGLGMSGNARRIRVPL